MAAAGCRPQPSQRQGRPDRVTFPFLTGKSLKLAVDQGGPQTPALFQPGPREREASTEWVQGPSAPARPPCQGCF